MKILVTGAPGWLGNRLVKNLVDKKEDDIKCLVLEGQDISSLKKLGVEIIEGDVSKKETLLRAVKDVEVIFHCAGLIHPKKIKDLYKVNYLGTKNLIDSAIDAGVKKFVHVSSNSPIGCNKKRNALFTEDSPYNPYLNYGRSKKLAEQYVNKMFKLGRIDITIVRPCWFYGPGQPPRQTTFFNMIKKGDPLVFGDGKNLRSMSYVDNIVQAMVLAANKKEASGQTYWIADEKPYSTLEIYNTIADIFNVDLKPRFIPKFVCTGCLVTDILLQKGGLYIKEIHVAGEMDKDIACSIEKAKRELGYDPKIGLKEGMERSIAWCKENNLL